MDRAIVHDEDAPLLASRVAPKAGVNEVAEKLREFLLVERIIHLLSLHGVLEDATEVIHETVDVG